MHLNYSTKFVAAIFLSLTSVNAGSVFSVFNNKCKSVFHCRQSSVRRVIPAYDYCRTLFVVWTVHSDLITARSAAVESWEEPANIWLTVAKNAFVGWALNFRVCMLLKGAVKRETDPFVCLVNLEIILLRDTKTCQLKPSCYKELISIQAWNRPIRDVW